MARIIQVVRFQGAVSMVCRNTTRLYIRDETKYAGVIQKAESP